ncbi:hypothetical protein JOD27_002300 [Lentzea nigeriaca]|nr:hypothetical protein [Lentzea nigeriaca]
MLRFPPAFDQMSLVLDLSVAWRLAGLDDVRVRTPLT